MTMPWQQQSTAIINNNSLFLHYIFCITQDFLHCNNLLIHSFVSTATPPVAAMKLLSKLVIIISIDVFLSAPVVAIRDDSGRRYHIRTPGNNNKYHNNDNKQSVPSLFKPSQRLLEGTEEQCLQEDLGTRTETSGCWDYYDLYNAKCTLKCSSAGGTVELTLSSPDESATTDVCGGTVTLMQPDVVAELCHAGGAEDLGIDCTCECTATRNECLNDIKGTRTESSSYWFYYGLSYPVCTVKCTSTGGRVGVTLKTPDGSISKKVTGCGESVALMQPEVNAVLSHVGGATDLGIVCTCNDCDDEAVATPSPTVPPTEAPPQDDTARPTAPPQDGTEQPTAPPQNDTETTSFLDECFSRYDTVQVQQKGQLDVAAVTMEDLRVGDFVLVDGTNRLFEPVYSFGHYHKTGSGKFLQIYTSSDTDDSSNKNGGPALELTPNHLVFLDSHKAVRADQLRVGDLLLSYGDATTLGTASSSSSSVRVTKISTVQRQGLYMPLTPSGKLVVNQQQLMASSYVSIHEMAPKVAHHPLIDGWLSEHSLLHWWLTPYRILCMGVSPQLCHLLDPSNKNTKKDDPEDKNDGILLWLTVGRRLAVFADQRGLGLQLIIGIPLLILGGLLRGVESLVGPSMAPTVLFLLAFLALRKKRAKSTKATVVEEKDAEK
jgi:hypothetical protein